MNEGKSTASTIEQAKYAALISQGVGTPDDYKSDLVADKEKLMLFISLDLDGFTALKSDYPRWPDIVNILVDRHFEGTRLWKFNGDEVIYAKKVTNLFRFSGVA